MAEWAGLHVPAGGPGAPHRSLAPPTSMLPGCRSSSPPRHSPSTHAAALLTARTGEASSAWSEVSSARTSMSSSLERRARGWVFDSAQQELCDESAKADPNTISWSHRAYVPWLWHRRSRLLWRNRSCHLSNSVETICSSQIQKSTWK